MKRYRGKDCDLFMRMYKQNKYTGKFMFLYCHNMYVNIIEFLI